MFCRQRIEWMCDVLLLEELFNFHSFPHFPGVPIIYNSTLFMIKKKRTKSLPYS